MKFQLTFKQNDVFDQLDFLKEEGNGDDDDGLMKFRECKKFAEKYVTYGEYITVEFDTEAQTAVAVGGK